MGQRTSKRSVSGVSILPRAIPRELTQIGSLSLKHGLLGAPARFGRAWFQDSALESPWSESRLLDLVGENLIRFFDDLGPVYGKAGQVVLSRLSGPLHEIAQTLRLTRLYKDWPPLSYDEVATILDHEAPRWRRELTLEPYPIGVASLAQVHAATDRTGHPWVVKIIKPRARKRLMESVEALEEAIRLAEPLAVTESARRLLKEGSQLCVGFRRELSLDRERQTIGKVRGRLAAKRQKLLRIPAVNEELSTDGVLVLERFQGTALSDVVEGKAELTPAFRKKLARKMLQELLVQVFELGLFHADPHAGNLILLDDGTVGLFDWGLAGELLDTDRRHIAAILRAVISLDQDKLVHALIAMGEESGRELTEAQVRKELRTVIQLFKKGQQEGGRRPSLKQLFEACLKSASRLGIAVPEGLLLMAKSLMTIEGLAKGLDPDVSLAKVATPMLFKAARPGLKDVWSMGRVFPRIAKQWLNL